MAVITGSGFVVRKGSGSSPGTIGSCLRLIRDQAGSGSPVKGSDRKKRIPEFNEKLSQAD